MYLDDSIQMLASRTELVVYSWNGGILKSVQYLFVSINVNTFYFCNWLNHLLSITYCYFYLLYLVHLVQNLKIKRNN